MATPFTAGEGHAYNFGFAPGGAPQQGANVNTNNMNTNGQGIVSLEAQVVRTELGVQEVLLAVKDTTIDEAGASSASRPWRSTSQRQPAARPCPSTPRCS